MKLVITFPAKFREEMERCMDIEQKKWNNIGKRLTDKVNKMLQRHNLGMMMKMFSYKFDSETQVTVYVRSTYPEETAMLKHFKKYEQAEPGVKVEEILESRL